MRQLAARLIPLLMLAAFLTACAARSTTAPPPAPSPVAATASVPDPAALIERGCFICLERALAAARRGNNPRLAFEAAALLAVRAKELGLPPGEWIDQARAAGGDDDATRIVLEIVEALPVDPLSGARDAVLTQTPTRLRAAAMRPQWTAALQVGEGSLPFRAYLQLALTCAADDYRTTSPGEIADSVPAEVRSVPLLQYRLGICGLAHAAVLRAVREADAEFADADYALARYEMQVRDYPDVDEALRLVQSAARAFPRSPAIATTAGSVHQMLETWVDALGAYDAALALVPSHPDALLGRTISLSHLDRHEQAVAAATQLVDEGRWFLGQALYWRAWNRFQLDDHLAARADADRARSVMVSPGVYLLSGMIDWRLRRLETAESEFEEALKMDYGQCEAATFLGAVRSERAKAAEALAAFKQAQQCYGLTITLRREAIARLDGSAATPSHKAREVARHQRAIDQAERRLAEAVNGIARLQEYLTSIQPQSPPPRR